MNAPRLSAGQAFCQWKLAELASHFAAPCPDAVMDELTEMTFHRLEPLAEAVSVSAEDILLKVFPLLLAKYEPPLGAPPLVPHFDRGPAEHQMLLESAIEDMRKLCPAIASALDVPHRNQTEVQS